MEGPPKKKQCYSNPSIQGDQDSHSHLLHVAGSSADSSSTPGPGPSAEVENLPEMHRDSLTAQSENPFGAPSADANTSPLAAHSATLDSSDETNLDTFTSQSDTPFFAPSIKVFSAASPSATMGLCDGIHRNSLSQQDMPITMASTNTSLLTAPTAAMDLSDKMHCNGVISQFDASFIAPSADSSIPTTPSFTVDESSEIRRDSFASQSNAHFGTPSTDFSAALSPPRDELEMTAILKGSNWENILSGEQQASGPAGQGGDISNVDSMVISDNVQCTLDPNPATDSQGLDLSSGTEMMVISDGDGSNVPPPSIHQDTTSVPEVIEISDEIEDGSLFGGDSFPDDEAKSTEPKGKGIDTTDIKGKGSDTTDLKGKGAASTGLQGLDTPAEMSCTLLPHQRIGLEWLVNHEEGATRGGILADDMGLGKTIQALALIFANPPEDPTRCKTTLIVAPLALLQQWPREISEKTKPGHKLSVHVFHGKGRKITHQELLRYDIVLTNYDTLCMEFKVAETKKTGMVLLHPDVHFHRVILDEAHNIKNRTALTSRGAFRLQADYRLCMTGTPLMNKAEELFAIVHFLQIENYGEWNYFKQKIAKPLRNFSGQAMRRIQKLNEKTMLCRKKTDLVDGKPIITLPERTDTLEYCTLDKDELAFYCALEKQTQVEIQKFMKALKGDRNFSTILVRLLRLRQACCHPDLLATSRKQKLVSEDDLQDLDPDTLEAFEGAEDADAPLALSKANGKTRNKAEKEAYYRELEEDYQPSAKITKTLELLDAIRQKAPDDKVIVFSFFTSYLDILAIGLHRAGHVYKRYDGTLNTAAKDLVLDDFVNPNSETKVLLTSLKSGNAGLNLNIANHVIIQEPYWNPFVEAQAIDRAHRIGQTKPVHVHRLLVKDTIEDRIVALQRKKSNMVALALGNGDGDGEEASEERQKIGGLTKEDVVDLLKPSARLPGGLPEKDDVEDELSPSSLVAAGPSGAGGSLSTAGRSSVAGPSVAGPSNAGPSDAGLSFDGSSDAGPFTAAPSNAGQFKAVVSSSAGPSTGGPSHAPVLPRRPLLHRPTPPSMVPSKRAAEDPARAAIPGSSARTPLSHKRPSPSADRLPRQTPVRIPDAVASPYSTQARPARDPAPFAAQSSAQRPASPASQSLAQGQGERRRADGGMDWDQLLRKHGNGYRKW